MHYGPAVTWRSLPIRLFLSFLFLSLLFSAAEAAAKKKLPAQPVHLNTATSEELKQVPGIGPATADKILKMRKSYGAFKSVDDLLAILGLGPRRLEKMCKYLTLGKAAAPKSAPQTAQPETKPIPSAERRPGRP